MSLAAQVEPQPSRRSQFVRFIKVLLALVLVGYVGLLVLGVGVSHTADALRRQLIELRVAEAESFIQRIQIGEEVYRATHDCYCAAAPSPAALPSGRRVPFDATGPCWRDMRWLPPDPVWFQYRVEVESPASSRFVIFAEADLDRGGKTLVLEAPSDSPVVRSVRNHGLSARSDAE